MNFGEAIKHLKAGRLVTREGWNGRGMWLILVPGSIIENARPGTAYGDAGVQPGTGIGSHIDMRTADGSMQPGWLASQADMLADDWMVCGRDDESSLPDTPRGWHQYARQPVLAEMRPYIEGEDLSGVSVGDEDRRNGSPQDGDMIARDPRNRADRWLVSEAYYIDKFDPIPVGPA